MYEDKQKKYEDGSLSERRRERKQPSSTDLPSRMTADPLPR